jgi:hypothetical protein
MTKPSPASEVERVFLPVVQKDEGPTPEPTDPPSPSPTSTPPPTGTSQRVAIDPITRIEGHLRIEVKVEDGIVTDAWSAGMMFRGIELILPGRDPRDAWVFAQRICGV